MNIQGRQATLNILFVCTGNTCRSPMAEYLLRHEFRKREIAFRVEVRSAGLSVRSGEKLSAAVSELLAGEGIKHDPAREALLLDDSLIEEADLILVMTARQNRQVTELFPAAAGRTFLLNEYCGLGWVDIEDPYEQGAEKYRRALEDIHRAIKNLKSKIGEG